ncbi:hypothetical protein AYL99_00711 [Fonsecaea erecta]|uniref:Mid2 domain-containing protein n=1 Tax=Fonsecaea erecta TaxID=1367422 RepID=A0A178ZY72_9EURO|nr:hypothetical protein AYL99_00711 [Fonsecaea erecta]OAP64739.1 hypothetical protein AYL99_00711 [Fonsecaea erecta]
MTSISGPRARPREVGVVRICILALTRLSVAYANNIARDSSEPDVNISNGTCYYSPGNLADPSYIPCGNTAFGIFSCCEAGSNCLDHNACYSNDGNTYVAGCTDPTYSDPSCPVKSPYDDQQWTGLVYCNGTSDEWTLCDDSGSGSDTVTPWPGCYCPEDETSRNVAFSAPGALAAYISLPSFLGGSMSFFDGYSPSTSITSDSASLLVVTTTFSDIPTSTSSTVTSNPLASTPSTTSASTISSAASAASNATDEHAHNRTGLSPGAKIGIGVGVGLGGLIVLAVIGGMAFYIRHLKQGQLKQEDTVTRPPSEFSAMQDDRLDGLAHGVPAWSGNASELAGSDSGDFSPAATQRAWTRPMSVEVEGSIPNHRSAGSLPSLESGFARSAYMAHKGAEAMPVEVQGSPRSHDISHTSYQPGRQVGDGVYEMPGHLPGSDFLEKRSP